MLLLTILHNFYKFCFIGMTCLTIFVYTISRSVAGLILLGLATVFFGLFLMGSGYLIKRIHHNKIAHSKWHK
jgi:hypothetical protein